MLYEALASGPFVELGRGGADVGGGYSGLGSSGPADTPQRLRRSTASWS
jgi:hypothetical protein